MIARGLTILIAAPIITACIYFGGMSFYILVTLLAIISVNEFYNLVEIKGFHPAFIIGNLATFVFMTFAQVMLKHPDWEASAAAFFTAAVIVTMFSGIFHRKLRSIGNIAVTIMGIIYVGWLFSYLVLLRAMSNYGKYLFFLLAVIWAGDVTAYLVGKFIGRTKLEPNISPKKTVEGALAGFAVSLLVAVLFGYYLIHINIIHSAILGVLIAITSQMSDLVESIIKRDVGAKDSSRLLPGHGGVLDRMDSFILSAPIIYYYISWFILK